MWIQSTWMECLHLKKSCFIEEEKTNKNVEKGKYIINEVQG